jgi:hypothetical protein
MSHFRRALSGLAIAVAALLFGAVTGDRFAYLVAALALASLGRRRLTPVSIPVQALLLIASGIIAMAMDVLPTEPGLADRPLRRVYFVLAGGALLLAVIRTHIHKPEGGLPVTLGLGLLVFIGCGSVVSGSVYLTLLIPYLLLCVAALRADARSAPSWGQLGWRHPTALATSLILASSVTFGILTALPIWYERSTAWMLQRWKHHAHSGFHDGPISLTSLEGLLLSDEVVMRIEGPLAGPLRGNVYAHYGAGHWKGSKFEPESTLHTGKPLWDSAESPTVVRYASSESDRFFLPREVAALQTEPTRARVNGVGVVRTLPDERPETVRFLVGARGRFVVAEPTQDDIRLPWTIASALEEIAGEWTDDVVNPGEKVNSILQRLERDYTYSLSFPQKRGRSRSMKIDPILHFLLQDPQGHCEYFATALALLARASGVPARFVTGYRPSERNPFLDYWVVRESHAHAWVEVHLPGQGWVTVDPSPLSSFEAGPRETTHWLPGLFDLAVFGWQRNGPVALTVLLTIVFVSIQILRLMRGREMDPSRRGKCVIGPPAYLEALLARLRDRGLPRRDAETLEGYAKRVASSAGDREAGDRCAAQDLLLRYAALRYGDVGSGESLRAAVRSWLASAAH